MVQHGSLFVTSFVFLMGLLFKVEGVTSESGVYDALSVIMLLLCVGFIVWWLYEMFSRVALKVCGRRSGVVVKGALPSVGGDTSDSGRGAVSGGRIGAAVVGHIGVVAPDESQPRTSATTAVNPLYRRGGGSDRGDAKGAAHDVAESRSGGGGGSAGAAAGAHGPDVSASAGSVTRPDARTAIVNPMHVRRHRTAAAAAASASSDGSARGDVDALTMYFNSSRAK
jgi:hypothetical protein